MTELPLLAAALETAGEPAVLAAGGAVLGVAFGFFAQRADFCLRAAVVEFARAQAGERLAVWLLAFATALAGVQALVLAGGLDLGNTRQLATRGSISGALVGGLLFGAGMVMTRGCASRLLVLSANGNLRALLSGLVFAVTAQAALGGALAPLRLAISEWWTVEGGAPRGLLSAFGIAPAWGGALAALWLAAAIAFALRSRAARWKWIGAIGVGAMVALAWVFTALVASHSFQVVPTQGVTFSGPSAEWLMRVLATPAPAVGFDTGLLPGVFAGSFAAAMLRGSFHLEGFKDGYSMRRYLLGAVCMGFGAMLAGGCAVGAGVSGGSVLSLTAWLALGGMWAGAAACDLLLDRHPQRPGP